MFWTLVAIAVWVAMTIVALRFGKAAAKPWPERVERFRRD